MISLSFRLDGGTACDRLKSGELGKVNHLTMLDSGRIPLNSEALGGCQPEDPTQLTPEQALDESGQRDRYECPVLVVEDDAGQREIALNGKLYTIGRDPKNDVYLRSQFVSRFHAVLVQVDRQTYRIVDGDVRGIPSTNGILINGQRKHSYELQTGDLVIFGPQARAIYRVQIQPLCCD